MFYITSADGRLFSGPLEKLRQVNKTSQSMPRQPHSDTQDKGADQRSPFEGVLAKSTGMDQSNHVYTPTSRALQQYNHMLAQQHALEVAYHAYQIMSQPVISLSIKDTWIQAYEIFENYPYQMMPVINQRQQLISVMSRRSLYHTLLTQPKSLRDQATLADLNDVKQPVISAAPVTDVRRIAAALVDNCLEAMPIINAIDEPIGIVSRTDIMRCVTADPPLSLWC